MARHLSKKDQLIQYLISGQSSSSFDPIDILTNPDPDIVIFLANINKSDWKILKDMYPDLVNEDYIRQIINSLPEALKANESSASNVSNVSTHTNSLKNIKNPYISNKSSFGKYLLLEPVDLTYDKDNNKKKLEKFLKLVQQMWLGVQNVMTHSKFKMDAIHAGLINLTDTYFDEACKLDEHSFLRCYTSRYILNYLFGELERSQDSDRMVLEDNFIINIYNLGGPQFPDHTFITLQYEGEFYILQSFYYQYSFRSIYGLTKLNEEGKREFNELMTAYKTFSEIPYDKSNDPHIIYLNQRFSKFTGIDSTRHTVYIQNINKIRNNPQSRNLYEKKEITTSLFFYIGSLKYKLNHMTLFMSKNKFGNPEIKKWNIFDAFINFDKIGPALSSYQTLGIYSGYENIFEIDKNNYVDNLYTIMYETNTNWIKYFYFYILQINLLFERESQYDLPRKLAENSLLVDQVLIPISHNLLKLEDITQCKLIGLISYNGKYFKLDSNPDINCLPCINYSLISSIMNLRIKFQDDSTESQISASRKLLLSMSGLSEDEYKEIEKSLRFKSKASKTRKSASKTRKSTSKTRKSTSKTRKSTSKTRKSTSKTRKSASKTRKSVSKKRKSASKTRKSVSKKRKSTSKTRKSVSKKRKSASKTKTRKSVRNKRTKN
jgi:hypothetical protein